MGGAVRGWARTRDEIPFDGGVKLPETELDFVLRSEAGDCLIECKMNHLLGQDDALRRTLYKNREKNYEESWTVITGARPCEAPPGFTIPSRYARIHTIGGASHAYNTYRDPRRSNPSGYSLIRPDAWRNHRGRHRPERRHRSERDCHHYQPADQFHTPGVH